MAKEFFTSFKKTSVSQDSRLRFKNMIRNRQAQIRSYYPKDQIKKLEEAENAKHAKEGL